MNNIEILKKLEKYISFANKQENFSHDTDYKWHKELASMIENLIQRNKDLEQIEKEHKEENGRLRKELENIEYIKRNFDYCLERKTKELEEENGRLREELSQYKRIDKLVSNITPEEVDTAIKRASEQFIEASKVEKELIQLNKDEKKERKGMKGQNKYFLKQQYAAKREILEKVLKMKGR